MTEDMCDKAVSTYTSTIKLVPEWYKTPKMCDEAVNWRFFGIYLYSWSIILDQYKAQEMCNKVIF